MRRYLRKHDDNSISWLLASLTYSQLPTLSKDHTGVRHNYLYCSVDGNYIHSPEFPYHRIINSAIPPFLTRFLLQSQVRDMAELENFSWAGWEVSVSGMDRRRLQQRNSITATVTKINCFLFQFATTRPSSRRRLWSLISRGCRAVTVVVNGDDSNNMEMPWLSSCVQLYQ